MSFLPSVKQKLVTESLRFRSSVSEFALQTIGKSVNWLIDRVDALDAGLAGQNVSYVIGVFQQDTVGGLLTYTCPVGQNAFVTLNVSGGAGDITFTMSTPQIISSTFGIRATLTGLPCVSFGVHVGSGQTVTVGNAVASVSGVPRVQITGAQYQTINLTVP